MTYNTNDVLLRLTPEVQEAMLLEADAIFLMEERTLSHYRSPNELAEVAPTIRALGPMNLMDGSSNEVPRYLVIQAGSHADRVLIFVYETPVPPDKGGHGALPGVQRVSGRISVCGEL